MVGLTLENFTYGGFINVFARPIVGNEGVTLSVFCTHDLFLLLLPPFLIKFVQ